MTKTPITENWQENRDYELIPHDENEWQVRILKGEFIECVIKYGGLSIDEEQMLMKFDLSLDYTPDADVKSEDPALQSVVGKILHSIMVGAFDEH
jgi:hypothetical protein